MPGAGLAAFALLIGAAQANEQAAPLSWPSDLAPKVAATPRLAGSDEAAAHFNDDMASLDAQGLEDREACLTAEIGEPWWERSAISPMTGPRFVTVQVRTGYNCGTAHPWTDEINLTYDLQTGREIDWASVLPPRMLDQPLAAREPTDRSSLRSPFLAAWYQRQVLSRFEGDEAAREQCARALSDEALQGVGLVLWLDAEEDGLMVQITGVDYFDTVCLNPEVVSTDELRRLGASPVLTDAIAAAHAAGNWRGYPSE